MVKILPGGWGHRLSQNKIKYTLSLVITIIGLLSLFCGTSYAILKGIDTSDSEQVIKAGSVELKLTEKFESIDKKITVMSDIDGLVQDTTYDFNLKNIGSEPAKFDIKLINEVPSNYTGEVLDIDYFRVGLEINGEEHGPMSLEDVKGIIDSDIIYEKELINYKLRIWLDEEKSDDLKEMEDYKAFLKLEVEAEQRVEEMDTLEAVTTFSYTGNVQEYRVPRDGYYYIEMAGGSGYAPTTNEDYSGGAKTTGYIYLDAGEKLYFYVGEKATRKKTTTFNGGGGAGYANAGYTISSTISGDTGSYGYTGGAATDVRLVGGSWDDMKSLISRIMVAGAGGSASVADIYNNVGGNSESEGLYGMKGGYYSGHGDNNCYGKGATQITGGAAGANLSSYGVNEAGSFGKGGTSHSYSSNATGGASGGGSGYYGGGAGGGTGGGGTGHGGGGGSSYISGFAGVNSVENSTTITHTNQTLHYSGKYFIGADVSGGVNFGDGYAKIVYVEEKPQRKNKNLDNVRYIKDCSSYSSYSSGNHWIEVQAIKDGVNVAKGKTVTGTIAEHASYPYSRITDGNITISSYAASTSYSTNQCVIIDLEEEYDLDEIAVWNYFGDQRSYYDNITYVSSDNLTWVSVINEASFQTSNGRRISAYNDMYNGYIQDNLVLWYDGYSNSGTTRNYTTTTWKDLSGTGYNGTLTGGTWKYKSLYFDGSDDTVVSNVLTSTLLPPTSDRTLSITLRINNVPYTNTTYGNIGVLIGGAYYGGMGIHWTRTTSETKVHLGAYTRTSTADVWPSYGDFSYPTPIINLTYVNNPSDGTVKIYLNGELIDVRSSITGSYTNVSTIGNVGINKAQLPGGNVPGSYANINVYDAQIYTKALTDLEIKHNYLYDKKRFNLE